MLKKFSFLLVFFVAFITVSCTNTAKDNKSSKHSTSSVQHNNPIGVETDDTDSDSQNDPTQNVKKKKKKNKGSQSVDNNNVIPDAAQSAIPQKVLKVLDYVRKNGEPMEGYVGGRTFQNRERLLDAKDASGKKIVYREWDVNPKIQGKNRGAERLVTGSDGRAYFTDDHYQSFVEIKNKN